MADTPDTQIQLFETDKGSPLPYSPSLLKSALQKAVRRNRADCAASCLKSLLLKDASAAARRLPVILIEDAILHPAFDELILVMRAAGRKAGITLEQAEWLLRLGVAAAVLEVRDPPPEIHPLRGMPVGVLSRLPAREAELVRAIQYRAAAGGMADDREMLRDFAGVWFHRFVERDWTVERLQATWAQASAEAEAYSWAAVVPAGPDSILPEAVDFHCTGVIAWLLTKPAISQLVAEQFPTRSARTVLQKTIWLTRAGVNLKTMLGFDRALVWEQDWPVAWGDGTHHRIKRIAEALTPLMNEYAEWVTRVT